MPSQLVVVSGPDAGRCFSLENRQRLVVGRGLQSDTQINDPRISRVHCRVEIDGSQAWLCDDGGAGGTLVGGQPVERHELREERRPLEKRVESATISIGSEAGLPSVVVTFFGNARWLRRFDAGATHRSIEQTADRQSRIPNRFARQPQPRLAG